MIGLVLLLPLPTQTPAVPAPTSSTTVPVDPVKAAKLLMNSGHSDDARKLLEALERVRPKDPQIQFLLAMLDMQARNWNGAIHWFRKILVSEPKNVRVRLELGRTYFLAGRYGDAERQFRFARAGRLSAATLANIDRFLNQIRRLKTLSYSFSFALAPDTNLNAGPAIDSVTLYGVPFQLSNQAKRNSGVGLTIDANGEWAPRIADKVKLRLGMQFHRAQYRKTDFDDMTLTTYAGPHLTLNRWDFNLAANTSRRWYGNRVYMNAYGAGFDATYYLSSRAAVAGGINIARRDYPQTSYQNGPGGDVSLSLFYTPTTSSVIRASAALGRQRARYSAYSNRSQVWALSYNREFRGGITLGIAPSFTHIGYDSPLAAFGRTRRDQQYSAQVALLNRRIDVHGFTPRFIYTFTRNDSNIPLYRFSRNRFEMGITRSF